MTAARPLAIDLFRGSGAGDIEEWRPVVGHAPFQISRNGFVRLRVNVTHPERHQWYYMKFETDKDGYHRIRLHNKHQLVHRLVFASFCGDLQEGMVVCHKDGTRTNNRWDNLLQATQKENIAHKALHGTHQRGEKHGRALYSDEVVAAVATDVRAAPRSSTGRIRRGTASKIAECHGVKITLVYSLTGNGNYWRHVT